MEADFSDITARISPSLSQSMATQCLQEIMKKLVFVWVSFYLLLGRHAVCIFTPGGWAHSSSAHVYQISSPSCRFWVKSKAQDVLHILGEEDIGRGRWQPCVSSVSMDSPCNSHVIPEGLLPFIQQAGAWPAFFRDGKNTLESKHTTSYRRYCSVWCVTAL